MAPSLAAGDPGTKGTREAPSGSPKHLEERPDPHDGPGGPILPPAIALQGHSAAFDGQPGGEPGSINPGETPAGTVPLDWDQAGPTLASDQNDQAVGLSWCTMPQIAASLAMGA